jgi:hypothetical protein
VAPFKKTINFISQKNTTINRKQIQQKNKQTNKQIEVKIPTTRAPKKQKSHFLDSRVNDDRASRFID